MAQVRVLPIFHMTLPHYLSHNGSLGRDQQEGQADCRHWCNDVVDQCAACNTLPSPAASQLCPYHRSRHRSHLFAWACSAEVTGQVGWRENLDIQKDDMLVCVAMQVEPDSLQHANVIVAHPTACDGTAACSSAAVQTASLARTHASCADFGGQQH